MYQDRSFVSLDSVNHLKPIQSQFLDGSEQTWDLNFPTHLFQFLAVCRSLSYLDTSDSTQTPIRLNFFNFTCLAILPGTHIQYLCINPFSTFIPLNPHIPFFFFQKLFYSLFAHTASHTHLIFRNTYF